MVKYAAGIDLPLLGPEQGTVQFQRRQGEIACQGVDFLQNMLQRRMPRAPAEDLGDIDRRVAAPDLEPGIVSPSKLCGHVRQGRRSQAGGKFGYLKQVVFP